MWEHKPNSSYILVTVSYFLSIGTYYFYRYMKVVDALECSFFVGN